MTDREKVVKKAERIMCSTVGRDMIDSFCEDVIELLKEQEPQETRLVRHYSRPGVYADLWLHCEKCGGKIGDGPYRPKYCPECGRAVKWDG